MATFAFAGLARQTKTIVKKNLLLLCLRNWFATLLQAAIIPIVIIALTLNIKNFGRSPPSLPPAPTPINSLRVCLGSSSKPLIIVTPPGLGSDVDHVVQQIIKPLADIPSKYILHQDPTNLPPQCSILFHGVSECLAVLTFNDSPLSKKYNGTWNYTLGADGRVSTQSDFIENNLLPIQLAVDNAITNSTVVPKKAWYSSTTPEQILRTLRQTDSDLVGSLYAIVYYLSMLPVIYHVANTITNERGSGMSQLIDAMGGSACARVLASTFAFNLIYLPLWIISGCLYWHILFPTSNAAIPIFWQILAGWATTNSAVFASSFFKGSRISGIFVAGSFLALAGGASIIVNQPPAFAIKNVTAVPLSLFFPSMSYIITLFHFSRFGAVERDLDMTTGMVPMPPGSPGAEHFDIPGWEFFLFLILQILMYPLLAVLAEGFMHGINFKGRDVATDQEGETSTVAVDVVGLTKIYATPWWKKVFVWKRAPELRAVDGLDLVAQKRQILCLLGVNGAGKSTTLDLLSGLIAQNSGTIKIHSSGSPLGICPQKNVMRDELTVLDHVNFWSEIKCGRRNAVDVKEIIVKCGLEEKMHSRAGKLSGGQKRKLQLACMFVGGSTVCFMDEVTTGLDPLSRRIMWDIILAERAKRSIIFTTHFLDEGDVLADHIVILSKGHIKCQGSVAELKSQYGGGYRIHLPEADSVQGQSLPGLVHHDGVVYKAEDSRSAAKLVSQLEVDGHKGVQMTGPTIEDVFLNLTKEDVPSDSDEATIHDSTEEYLSKQLSPGQGTSFWKQVRILLRKRLTILPRYWMSTCLALVLPIACVPAINKFVAEDFRRSDCKPIGYNSDQNGYLTTYFGVYLGSNPASHPYYYRPNAIGPPSANESLYKVLRDFPIGESFNISRYAQNFEFLNDLDSFHQYLSDTNKISPNDGGIYVGDDSTTPEIASTYSIGRFAAQGLNILSQVRSGVPIAMYQASRNLYYYEASGSDSWVYVVYACFILAVYPSFFSLYPAYEKTRQIRALQYSNGVRPLPLWTAYFLFDFVFVLIVSIAFSLTIYGQFSRVWWQPLYMLPLCILYGITGILISYIFSIKAPSQLTAFLWTIGYMVLSFFALAVAFTVPNLTDDQQTVQNIIDHVTFILNIFFPIGNIFRAMGVGLNMFRLACRNDTEITNPNDIFAYGLPILYLVLQCLALPFVLIWADSDLSLRLFRRSRSDSSTAASAPPPTASAVEKESHRVQNTDTDLLQLSHVTKSFDASKPPAVDDVSLGLGQGEILALLGPNGAGKSTIVNMIRGVMKPDSGSILIRGVDAVSNPRQAQKSLGVCPQFDALDLLTARQHVQFYARIKGVSDPVGQAEVVMAKVGLLPFASRLASKLSGGNKRKLSLAIALTGNPDVLVLDEPSSAMDAAAKRKMWKVLADIAPGRSLLLTTHSMEEADALATRAAILSGKMLALGTTQSLRERYANLYHVHLVLRSAPTSTEKEMEGVEEWVKEEFGDVVFEGVSLGGQVKFMVPAGDGGKGGIAGVVEVLEGKREELGLSDYSVGAPTLERVFLSVVKDVDVDDDDGRPRRKGLFGRLFGRK